MLQALSHDFLHDRCGFVYTYFELFRDVFGGDFDFGENGAHFAQEGGDVFGHGLIGQATRPIGAGEIVVGFRAAAGGAVGERETLVKVAGVIDHFD
ncbi:hypothetical protein [Martelella sp. FOR1707]